MALDIIDSHDLFKGLYPELTPSLSAGHTRTLARVMTALHYWKTRWKGNRVYVPTEETAAMFHASLSHDALERLKYKP